MKGIINLKAVTAGSSFSYTVYKAIDYTFIPLSNRKFDSDMKTLITPLKSAFNQYVSTHCRENPLDPNSAIVRAHKSNATVALLAYLFVTEGTNCKSPNDLPDDYKLPCSHNSYEVVSKNFGKVREFLEEQGDKKGTISNRISQLGKFFKFYFRDFAPVAATSFGEPYLRNPVGPKKWPGKNLTRMSTKGGDITLFGKRLDEILERCKIGPFQLHTELLELKVDIGEIQGYDISNWVSQKCIPSKSKIRDIRKFEEAIVVWLNSISHPLANCIPRNHLSSVACTINATHDEIVGETKDEHGKCLPIEFKQRSGKRRETNFELSKNTPIWDELRSVVETRLQQTMLKTKPVERNNDGTLSKSKGAKFDSLLCFETERGLVYPSGQSVYVQAFCTVISLANTHQIISPGEESIDLWISTKFLTRLSEIVNLDERSTAIRNYQIVRRWLFQVTAGNILTVSESNERLAERLKNQELDEASVLSSLAKLDRKFSNLIAAPSNAKKKGVRLYLEKNFPDFPENPDIHRIYEPFIRRVRDVFASRTRYSKGSIYYHQAVRKAAVLAVLISKPMRLGSLQQARYSSNGYFTNNAFHKSGSVWSFDRLESKTSNRPTGTLISLFTEIFDEYVFFSRDFFLPDNDSANDFLFPNRGESNGTLYDLASSVLKDIGGVNFTGHMLRTLCGTVLCIIGKPEVAAGMLDDTLETVLTSYADCLPNNRSSQWQKMIA